MFEIIKEANKLSQNIKQNGQLKSLYKNFINLFSTLNVCL